MRKDHTPLFGDLGGMRPNIRQETYIAKYGWMPRKSSMSPPPRIGRLEVRIPSGAQNDVWFRLTFETWTLGSFSFPDYNPDMAKILESILTCPNCGARVELTMPTDACQFFFTCEQCQATVKPLPGDCCVFCSYGSVPCPPEQS
jgi:hypothetical protein